MNPASWLDRAARRWPEAPALFWGEKQIATYRDFNRTAGAVGKALADKGVKAGDRVGVFMSNRPDYLIALYGIWYLGAVAVPINGKLHVKEAGWILENAEVSCAFVSDDIADGLDALVSSSGCSLISVDQDEFAEAVAKYNYSPEFQKYCYQLAEEGVQIANQWQPAGMPIHSNNNGSQ